MNHLPEDNIDHYHIYHMYAVYIPRVCYIYHLWFPLPFSKPTFYLYLANLKQMSAPLCTAVLLKVSS